MLGAWLLEMVIVLLKRSALLGMNAEEVLMCDHLVRDSAYVCSCMAQIASCGQNEDVRVWDDTTFRLFLRLSTSMLFHVLC